MRLIKYDLLIFKPFGHGMVKLKLLHVKGYLQERFSNSWEQIQILQSCDEDFKIICDDYLECMRLIDRACSDNLVDPEFIEEYRDLCDELESEIAYYLNVSSERHPLARSIIKR